MLGDVQSREWSSPAISNLWDSFFFYRTNEYIDLIIRNYHSLRSMHVRGDQDPYHTVRRSLTEAQESNIYN
jgi:hypothetical protein